MGVSSPSSLCINDVLSPNSLFEILLRLPRRELFLCKLVCKLWLSCIQDNHLYFARRFILQTIDDEKQNKRKERKKLIAVKSKHCGMFLVASSSGSSTSSSRLTLNFLPFFDKLVRPDRDSWMRDVVLASDNGLLVCSPNDPSSHAEYHICNPLTKQCLALPLPPRCEARDIGVGLICDPFCSVDVDLRSVNFNDRFVFFKLVRIFAPGKHEIGVQMFSSLTGWSTLKPPKGYEHVWKPRFDSSAVSYNGKLYWLEEQCLDLLVFDPGKNSFLEGRLTEGPPRERHRYAYKGYILVDAMFSGLSVCRGSLWIGQCLYDDVRVFVLENGVWRMKHDLSILSDMRWSWSLRSRSMKRQTLCHEHAVRFLTIHPDDPMVAYLSLDGAFLECDFRDRTVQVLSDDSWLSNVFKRGDSGRLPFWSNVLTLSLPPWPTPLPLLPRPLLEVQV